MNLKGSTISHVRQQEIPRPNDMLAGSPSTVPFCSHADTEGRPHEDTPRLHAMCLPEQSSTDKETGCAVES